MLSELEIPPHKPQFGDARTSVFDVIVTSASDLPFELPVSQFLEETCAGMRGGQAGDGELKTGSLKDLKGGIQAAEGESRHKWRSLRTAFELEAVRVICTSLFWLAVGSIFGTVAEEANAELRAQLAHSWFSLTLELRGPDRGPRTRSSAWALDMIPVALVQALFRLLVDAFPPEHERIVRTSDSVLDRLTQVVYQEVLGFCPSQESLHVLRMRLFCENVIRNPAANQEESMRSELRREKQSRRNRLAQSLPLSFGDLECTPLEDTQLEHVLEQRERDRERSSGDRRASGQSPRREKVDSDAASPQKARLRDRSSVLSPIDILLSGFLPLGAEALSVDRYASLSAEGEEIMERQLTELYPDDCDGGSTCSSLDTSPLASRAGSPKSAWASSMASRPNSRAGPDGLSKVYTGMSRSKSMRAVSSDGSTRQPLPARRNPRRGFADAAERRRRDEVLAERLERPVQEGAALRTVLVSPIIDRLAPSDGDRGVLKKPFFEARDIQTRRPRPVCLSPLPPLSQSEPTLGESQNLQPTLAEQASFSRRLPKGPAFGAADARSDKKPSRPEEGAMSSSANGRFVGSKSLKREVLTCEPPATLKHDVVMGRLSRQAENSRQQSFDQYKKDYDMTTGQRKNLNDPSQLHAEERLYIKRVQDMVGKPSSKAPRNLRQNAYSLSKGRSQLVKRKEKLLRGADPVTSAIFANMSDVGTVSILKSLAA